MYNRIIHEINLFLRDINVGENSIDGRKFQAVLIKRLSNQNIIKEKRRIPRGQTTSSVNQTHIDFVSKPSRLFLFEILKDTTTTVQAIDIDLFKNNYNFLQQSNNSITRIDESGTTYIERKECVYSGLERSSTVIHSSAYKKYGHAGVQTQINIPDAEEVFTRLHHMAFLEDALILLRYDFFHYLALIVPKEKCGKLYSLARVSRSNVNCVFQNDTYDETIAKALLREDITTEINHEIDEVELLQGQLQNSEVAGTEIERVIKARVSQGEFRRLMLLAHDHTCQMCGIKTTEALRASHIKQWSLSSKQERMDVDNGLLLCANHDALFDRYIMTFNVNDGSIIIADSVDSIELERLNIPADFHLQMSERMKLYMKFHNSIFNEKNQ